MLAHGDARVGPVPLHAFDHRRPTQYAEGVCSGKCRRFAPLAVFQEIAGRSGIIGYEFVYPRYPIMKQPALNLGSDLVKLIAEINELKGIGSV